MREYHQISEQLLLSLSSGSAGVQNSPGGLSQSLVKLTYNTFKQRPFLGQRVGNVYIHHYRTHTRRFMSYRQKSHLQACSEQHVSVV